MTSAYVFESIFGDFSILPARRMAVRAGYLFMLFLGFFGSEMAGGAGAYPIVLGEMNPMEEANTASGSAEIGMNLLTALDQFRVASEDSPAVPNATAEETIRKAVQAAGFIKGSAVFLTDCEKVIRAKIKSVDVKKVKGWEKLPADYDKHFTKLVFSFEPAALKSNCTTVRDAFGAPVLLSKQEFFLPKIGRISKAELQKYGLAKFVATTKPRHMETQSVVSFSDKAKKRYVIIHFEGNPEGDAAESLLMVVGLQDEKRKTLARLKDMFECNPWADVTGDGVPELLCVYPYNEVGLYDFTTAGKPKMILRISSGV